MLGRWGAKGQGVGWGVGQVQAHGDEWGVVQELEVGGEGMECGVIKGRVHEATGRGRGRCRCTCRWQGRLNS